MKNLCIYHGSNCVDGFAAAWVVHRALGDEVEFVAASYGEDPPDVADRDILIVDFSYKRPVLEAMAALARSVLVLDHHKSAAEDLEDIARLDQSDTWDKWLRAAHSFPTALIMATFNMSRSGAVITWDFFNPGVPRPWFINLVEDRDLWRFTDDRSRPFHAAVTSYPLDFALWDRLYAECLRTDNLDVADALRYSNGSGDLAYDLIKEGTGILRKHDLDVQTVIRTTRRTMVIGGVRVPVCNCPPWLASDVGHELCNFIIEVGTVSDNDKRERRAPPMSIEVPPFSATYYDCDGKRNFSLRSRPEGADVSKICALYGGGGHRNAGGFERPQGWEGDE